MKAFLVAALLIAIALLACTVDVELAPPGPLDASFPPNFDGGALPDADGLRPDAGLRFPDAQPAGDAL